MKKRVYGKLFAVMLAISTVFMTFAVFGGAASAEEEKCSLQIHVDPVADTCELRISEVGKYTNGTYVLNEEFADCGADMKNLSEASAAQAAAQKLADVVSKSEAGEVKSVDSEGNVSFDLTAAESTVYVVFQESLFDIIKISPMLVVLPHVDEDGNLVKSMKIDAKYELIPQKEFGAVILNKYDLNKKPLKGAEFNFERKSTSESGEAVWEVVATGLVTDKNGQIVVKDLEFGTYRFVETKAPAGFKLGTSAKSFTVRSKGSVKLVDGVYVADEGEPVIYDVVNEPVEESSEPESSIEVSMPEPSGPVIVTGEDIAKFIIVGVVVGVSLVAVVLLVVLGRKKKNDSDEDEE